MSDKLRARARELALEAFWTTSRDPEKEVNAIEAAILQFAREALREEPDREMIKAAHHFLDDRSVYRVMAEARARGLE
jgi:hypothetical protein